MDALRAASTSSSWPKVIHEEFHESVDDHYITYHKRRVALLSVSGGGVRGIIPSLFVKRIEERTGMPAYKLFNVFSGVSAGGIVIAGLNRRIHPQVFEKGENKPIEEVKQQDDESYSPLSGDDLVKLFKDESTTIFPPKSYYNPMNWIHDLIWAKYTLEGLDKVLKKNCGPMYISETINPIVIPAAEMPDTDPWWFSSTKIFISKQRRQQLASHNDFKVHEIVKTLPIVDILEASAAAPTFFPYKELEIKGSNYFFMDGGTIVNNPVVIGTDYAESLYGSHCEDIAVCLGTGVPEDNQLINLPADWGDVGLLSWGRKYPEKTIALGVKEASLEMEVSSKINKRHFYLYQPEIDNSLNVLDCTDPLIFKRLEECAEKFIKENQNMFEEMCDRLVKNSQPDGRAENY